MLFTEKMWQDYLRLCNEETNSKEESTPEPIDKPQLEEGGKDNDK